MAHILLLEDDATLNETITEYLQEEGYSVESLYDGEEAQDRLYEKHYDLLLLDVNTPGINGFDLLNEARANGVEAPAIYITSLDSVEDLEKGYLSGCDDYIRKPFELKELKIRIDNLLKRGFFHRKCDKIIIDEGIVFYPKNSELRIQNEVVRLGLKEQTLLRLFLKHPDEIISHERIFSTLWSYDETPSDTALRTYIKNLRKTIGKSRIVSVKKQGYKFVTKK